MGQSSSDFSIDGITDGIRQQTSMLKEMVSVTYSSFIHRIQELNQISKNFNDTRGTQLMFVVKPGSDSSIFWKNTVRIACLRVDLESRNIVSHRLLNLNQFLKLYHILVNHSSASCGPNKCAAPSAASDSDSCCSDTLVKIPLAPLKDRRDISASFIFQNLDCLGDPGDSDLSECCICMERKPDVTLPCAHSYCLPCIEQWNVTNKTCPICREELPSTEDSWVISEAPDSAEVTAELRRALDGVMAQGST